MENYVAEIGPGLFIVMLFVTPWLWGVPMAFASAELSSRKPVAGGYYRWVQTYLGEFPGYLAGIWSLFSSFLDNALYPVLFARSITHFVPSLTRFDQWLIAVVFIAAPHLPQLPRHRDRRARGHLPERVPPRAPRLARRRGALPLAGQPDRAFCRPRRDSGRADRHGPGSVDVALLRLLRGLHRGRGGREPEARDSLRDRAGHAARGRELRAAHGGASRHEFQLG